MRNLIVISVCAAALCGCAQSLDAPMSPTFGRAVASMDAQIIPAPISEEQPPSSGARAAAAIGRYEKGEVYKPETQATSSAGAMGASYGAK
jgi:hypothetical protein